MKAFTTLMKVAIMGVSIALVAMLVTSVMPLVMGGVDLRSDQDLEINYDLTAVDVTGIYTVVSSIDQDISDLTVEAYLVSKDGSLRKDLVTIGPVSLNKDNPEVQIVIDESIPIAEVALFFVTDNMDSSDPGLVLPVNIRIAGSYSNNLAGVDMTVTYNLLLSETGSFQASPPTLTDDGEVSKAEVKLSGFEDTSLIAGIIPAGGAEFSVTIGGKTIDLSIDKDSEDILLDIATGDLSQDSIMSVVDALLDAIENGDDQDIEFTFVGGDSAPHNYTLNPKDMYSENPEVAEQAQKYADQIEGISASLDEFLKKYAELGASS